LVTLKVTCTNWTNYTTKDGLANNMVSTLRRLQDGTILVGNAKGISRFDGRSWTPYALPAALRIDRESKSSMPSVWVKAKAKQKPLAPAA
jgi:hypothetical protein